MRTTFYLTKNVGAVMKMRTSFLPVALACSLFGLFATQPAWATANNNSPPAGAILDLAGGETGTAAQTINHGAPVQESVTFSAALTNTDITLAFREDPAFVFVSDVSLVDNTTSSGNLLTNGDFSGATYNSNGNGGTPVGWNYANVFGATFGGGVTTNCDGGTSFCWEDGAVQAYDAIDQVVATNPGDSYTLSFYYTDNGGLNTFSDLSTNGDTSDTGGSGADILAYAQAGLPTACPPGEVCTNNAPEPGSPALIFIALMALTFIQYRNRKT
jgi:hypothetical protein